MKKSLLIIALLLIAIGLSGQNKWRYAVKAYGGISVGGTYVTDDANTTIDSIIVDADGNVWFFAEGDTLNPKPPLSAGVDADQIYPELADTNSVVVFGFASLQAGDTAVFNNGAWAGAVYYDGSDSLVLVREKSALGAGSGTETLGYNIYFSDTLGAVVPTKIHASDITVTEVIPTKGHEVTSFTVQKIPGKKWLWAPISGVSAGNRPSFFTLTLSGYKIPKY